MAEETKETASRKKPKFLRNDWHKKIKLGRGVKKNQKWRGAKGIHSKVRLNRRGHPSRPRIGFGNVQDAKHKVQGHEYMRVENLASLAEVPKGHAIIIGSIGKRKRDAILAKAKEQNIRVLNKYKEHAHATR